MQKINSRNTPQFLFFIALEFLHQSNFEQAQNYLDKFMPTNSEVFKMLKDNIDYPLSLNKVLKTLEVFEIYSEDLNYDMYLEINNFVNLNIENYKSNLISQLKKKTISTKKPIKMLWFMFTKMRDMGLIAI